MLYPILPQPSANRTVFSRTRDYLSSMPYNTGRTAEIFVCQKQNNEIPDLDSGAIIVARMNDFHVMSVVLHDEDSIETVSTFEGNKIRVGDRLFRNVTVAGFLLDGAPLGSSSIRHRGHSNWLSFYEKARFSQIAGSRNLAVLIMFGVRFFGAFVSYNITNNADEPNKMDLSATFVCLDVQLPVNLISTVTGTDFKGKISYEGLAHAGVIGPIAYDPTSVILDLTNTGAAQDAAKLYLNDDNSVPTAVSLPAMPPPPVVRPTKPSASSFKIFPS